MFALEHSKAAYWVDYLLYATAIAGLTACVLLFAPPGRWIEILALMFAGLAVWPLIEYAMHRFVLHGVEPFKSWHAVHHGRPSALVSTPTILSSTLIALLVFVPVLLVGTLWSALAITLGLTAGYLTYAVCHHAAHHWRPRGRWMLERKRWHALHHARGGAACYGVTSTLWDRVLRTGPL